MGARIDAKDVPMNDEQQVQQVLEEVPSPDEIDPQAPPHVVLHAPTDARNLSLIVLTTLAVLAILKWASAFFIPLMLGFIFYYALSPVVEATAAPARAAGRRRRGPDPGHPRRRRRRRSGRWPTTPTS